MLITQMPTNWQPLSEVVAPVLKGYCGAERGEFLQFTVAGVLAKSFKLTIALNAASEYCLLSSARGFSGFRFAFDHNKLLHGCCELKLELSYAEG